MSIAMRKRNFVERNVVVYYFIIIAIVEGKLHPRLYVFCDGSDTISPIRSL